MATSQIKQYDGLFKFCVEEPYDNYEYDKEKNPLGIEEFSEKSFISAPCVLEYKYNVDALIREFESEDKNEKDINLVIAWEFGEEWKKNYEVISLLDLENLHHRKWHGITHQLEMHTTVTQVIILKELVEYLNDVEGVQESQKVLYGDDLF